MRSLPVAHCSPQLTCPGPHQLGSDKSPPQSPFSLRVWASVCGMAWHGGAWTKPPARNARPRTCRRPGSGDARVSFRVCRHCCKLEPMGACNQCPPRLASVGVAPARLRQLLHSARVNWSMCVKKHHLLFVASLTLLKSVQPAARPPSLQMHPTDSLPALSCPVSSASPATDTDRLGAARTVADHLRSANLSPSLGLSRFPSPRLAPCLVAAAQADSLPLRPSHPDKAAL